METIDQPDERELWARYAAAAPPAPSGCPPLLDLAAWLDGNLAEPQRESVEAHLCECAPCRRAVADARAIAAEGETAAAPGAAESAVRRARALVAGEAAGVGIVTAGPSWRLAGRAGLRRAAGWSLAAAASIAICAGGWLAGSWAAPGRPLSEEELVAELSFGVLGPLGAAGGLDLLLSPVEEAQP